ncbi:hypothetical protein [Thioalkalivibrio thiocyanodenitrificans]|uniref:hypothetical protein n=1 Tax=Thioalkalivibrio thiocyanodenitrificans TaxID=243063 RepID=UPI00037272E0|nr:hypothetical protein [Thioalkalivibrio thiocyanodenitrificans]
MDEQTFKAQFIASFLAAWAARNFDQACMTGNHEIFDHPPVEDAQTIADLTWAQWFECGGTQPCVALSEEPLKGLLMSMALRYDHGLGCPGYYDQLYGEGEHQRRLDAALSLMRQIYEEVSGHGFYRPELEERYLERMAAVSTPSEKP